MDKFRLVPAKGLVDEHVQWRGRQPFLAAQDMRDLHKVVVDDDRQVIGRHAVALEQHRINWNALVFDHYFAANRVVDGCSAFQWDGEAHDMGAAFGLEMQRAAQA